MQILVGVCVILWLIVTMWTVKHAISGKMFIAPCLGTDLFLRRATTTGEEPIRS